MEILDTGSAGFKKARVCEILPDEGDSVCGEGSARNACYEVSLKKVRPLAVKVK